MRENYDESLRRMLKHEGGYTNDPDDPGGPTNFGITIYDYRKYINKNGKAADVRNMSVDQAKQIYRTKYWDAQKCDDLPHGVDYAIFDYGVNSGIGRSGKVLRRILGLDDSVTAVTAGVIASAKAKDPASLVNKICDERLAFLKKLKTWAKFGRGWGARVSEVRAAALAMIRKAAVQAPPEPEKPAPGKAEARPWYQRGFVGWILGVLAGGGFTAGSVSITDALIYSVCVLVSVLMLALAFWVYVIPPRGSFKVKMPWDS